MVYRGALLIKHTTDDVVESLRAGHEAGTGRKVAIKKIKVGQFKDGLDMSAIREVKYLRELHHQNVIAVRPIRAYDETSFDLCGLYLL